MRTTRASDLNLPSGVRTTRAGNYLARAAASYVRAAMTRGGTPEGCAKGMFGGDPVIEIVIRTATSQAKTTGSGWADALAAQTVDDFVLSIAVLSAGAALIAKGLRINFDHYASIRLPGRTFNPASAGAWIAENADIPVVQPGLTASIMYPRKLAVITSWTEELAHASNIDEVARALIAEAAAQALDAALLGSQPDNGAIPQGILNGATPLSPSGRLGSALETAAQDIAALAAELAKHGAGLDPIIIAAVPQATALKTLVPGKNFDIPVSPSAALAAGTVLMVEAGSFASAFGAVPEFSTTSTAVLHYEDSAPTDITGGTPSPAVPARSLYQTNGVALRMVLRAGFGMRNRAHVAVINGCNWP